MVGIRILALSLLLLLPPAALAQTQTITVTHTYTLGDNDSRNDARQLCLLEAKRKILEKVGSYVESQTEVSAFRLTSEQIKSFSAAVLSAEIVNERFSVWNGRNALTLVVKADVDITDVRKRLEATAKEKQQQERIAREEEQKKQAEFREYLLARYRAKEWLARSNGRFGLGFDCFFDEVLFRNYPHTREPNEPPLDCGAIEKAAEGAATKKTNAHLRILQDVAAGVLSEEAAEKKLQALLP